VFIEFFIQLIIPDRNVADGARMSEECDPKKKAGEKRSMIAMLHVVRGLGQSVAKIRKRKKECGSVSRDYFVII